jgi:hypothetical protein
LILHAVDLVVGEIELREDSADREEALALLRALRQELLNEASSRPGFGSSSLKLSNTRSRSWISSSTA